MSSDKPIVFTCDICGEEDTREPELDCCGVKYCFPCANKTWGLCHVCKKDELNEPLQCDMCGCVENAFTIQMCAQINGTCDMYVCNDCNRDGIAEKPVFKYCSHKHFQEMLDDLWKQ